jgi:glycosyltransferase involved in cell wall biosynthesis
MKVYIVTKEPFPKGMAATNRIICLAKAFISAGIDCMVIVFSRKYKDHSVPGIGIFEGVPYEYIGGSTKRPRIMWVARLQALWLRVALLCYMNKKIKSGDVVYDFIGGLNRLKDKIIGIVHRKGGFCVRELNEYPFGTGKETKNTIKQREYAFKYLFPRYDGIIAISDALVDVAKKYCSPRCVIQKIPILVDFEKYNLQDKSSLTPIPYIFHAGTLYEQKDGILGMIEAFGIATQELDFPIKFICTGSKEKSPYSQEIDFIIEKYHIENNVEFTGFISKDKLRSLLTGASICIINKYPNQQNRYCFSTKLGEYMAAGKPIIITHVGEAVNWLENYKDALIVEPQDIQALTNAIVKLFCNKDLRNAIGNNARETCHQAFDYKCHGRSLKHFLQTLKTKD